MLTIYYAKTKNSAARSLGLSGLVSGSAKMRSRHSISAMVCSGSVCHNI
jgi:hypothetical protein